MMVYKKVLAMKRKRMFSSNSDHLCLKQFNLIQRTFSAKNANNIDEHLRTCLELSKQVSKELLDDNLMV